MKSIISMLQTILNKIRSAFRRSYKKYYPKSFMSNADFKAIDKTALNRQYNYVLDLILEHTENPDSEEPEFDTTAFIDALFKYFINLIHTRFDKDNELYEFFIAFVVFMSDSSSDLLATLIHDLFKIAEDEYEYQINLNMMSQRTIDFIEKKIAEQTPYFYVLYDVIDEIYPTALYRYYMLTNKQFPISELLLDFISIINAYNAIRLTKENLSAET